MAGHSKWANIKFRKMGQDAKRGKLFTRYIREITVATRQGGGDSTTNPRLRTVIDKALAANMTRDQIDRAIKRGLGGQVGDDIEEVRYEGYGPGGVALMIDCMTNNRNRTVGEIRHLLDKQGGNLGITGSVAYLFEEKGQFIFGAGLDEQQVLDVALACDAEDLKVEPDGSLELLSSPAAFDKLKMALEAQGLQAERSEIAWVPKVTVLIDAEALAQKLFKLLDALEELDDVQMLYSNAVFDAQCDLERSEAK